MKSKKMDFYLNKTEPNKSCLLALRDVLSNFDDEVEEIVKYGMPCFLYKGKMFCYLWIDKKSEEPYILFVEGKHLIHPQLVLGTRKRMKTLSIKPQEDIPIVLLEHLLTQALDLYRKGVIKTPK